jgi:predicted ferric reductase
VSEVKMKKRVLQLQTFLRHNAGGDAAVFLAFVGLGITAGFAMHDATYEDTHSSIGLVMLLGRLAGLLGTYLILIVMIVIARVPWVEKSLGFDHLVEMHRKIAPVALILISIHIVTISLAYANQDDRTVTSEFVLIVTTYSWMIPALVAFLMLAILGFTSLNIVRRGLKYESWWKVHLLSYGAVVLSFMHQILTGSLFLFNQVAKFWWILLHAYTAFALVTWRFVFPIARSFRHKLRVDHVVVENADTCSVYIKGENLLKIHAHGGSFFEWRFLSKSLWGQAHPYSLSAAPTNQMLRITVKNLGDHSASLRSLKPGIRVVAEGPYGIFNARRSAGHKVVLIGGGVGITPIRAILEDLPEGVDVDLIYRAEFEKDIILRSELENIAPTRNIRLHFLIGGPDVFPMSATELLTMVPHLSECDVFLCGPPGLAQVVLDSCIEAGVGGNKVHHEAFAFGAH